jgi:hypothetical protein
MPVGADKDSQPEHVEILKQGVEVWNKWRRGQENLIGAVGLSLADLRSADMTGANLIRADLHLAILSSANLRGADFTGFPGLADGLVSCFDAGLASARHSPPWIRDYR